ncbi:MAG: gliding motility protein GldC [Saprospiraceae bacterium]|nr:gliding motility protein GldC [Saprospiraceae bacterium]
MNKKTSQISINIELGDDKIPEHISWSAPDQNQLDQPVKAMLLSLFDGQNKQTLKIDLWTKEMQVVEMDRFFYQTLRSMTESYFKATNNQSMARAMQQFVQYFGEQTEIIPKEKN